MTEIEKVIKMFFGCFVMALVISCESENRSIDVYSNQINNKAEKIETLKKYLAKESGLIDAEYHIWFQDNGSGRVPAPSDWNITVALQVESDSLDSWKQLQQNRPSSKLQFLWKKV